MSLFIAQTNKKNIQYIIKKNHPHYLAQFYFGTRCCCCCCYIKPIFSKKVCEPHEGKYIGRGRVDVLIHK